MVVSVVFDADEEVDGVLGDFESFVFGFEVKSSERAGCGPMFDKFWVEVKDEF